jgi:hypothetical protein
MATAGRATTDAMSTADRAVTQHRSALSSLKNIALGVAGSYAAIKTADFVRDSITAAGNLAETQNKVGVIFRNSADEVERFATNSRRNILLTQQQALDAASSFGIFGKSAGLTGGDLADFSTDLTGLASDLSSFSNTTPEQAIDALGSALRGESEPIRSYGVLLDEATLRQRALRMGLIETTTQALTPQQRVLAAYNEILAQTTLQQGDAARTQDSYSNQVRILSKNWADFQVQIGTELLPVATRLIRFLNDEGGPVARDFGRCGRRRTAARSP